MVGRFSRVWDVVCALLPGPLGQWDSVLSEGLGFWEVGGDGRNTERSLTFSTRLMAKSFPRSGVANY